MLNVRVPPQLIDEIDEAARKQGVSRSVWMRQVLEEGTKEQSTPMPLQGRSRGGQMDRRQCTHPPTARRTVSTRRFCDLCGETWKL